MRRAIALPLLAACLATALAACSAARRAPAPPPETAQPEPAAPPTEPQPEVEAARIAEESIERVDVAGLAAAEAVPPEARVLAEVPFAPGDAELGAPALERLAALIDELRARHEPYRLELETDGEEALARQRAQAVKAHLEEAAASGAAPIQILPAPSARAGRTDRVLIVLRQP